MRYFGSFFITLILYAATITSLFYSFNNQSNITNKEEKKSLVKVSLIEAKVEQKKEIEQKKEKERIKSLKKEPKKIVKKIIKSVKKPKKKIVKKIIKSKTCIKNETKEVKKSPSKNVENIVSVAPKINISKIKNDYIAKVKKTINSNKFYPNSARRRGIEGSVKVEFTIQNNGKLTMVKIIQGKKIFFKAAKEAIINSFPIQGYKDNKIFPINLTLVLKYNLK
ncbi:TonB family protein [Halarcobacter sp.]|uniref:energy transducer TonB n=1 Tax=Halarcobacter sp. TaxID=2321133 RepID=UPI002AA6FB46|nr:TonB family protein [Halarcobacter sp.]